MEDYSDNNPKWKGCQQCDGPNPMNEKGEYIVFKGTPKEYTAKPLGK